MKNSEAIEDHQSRPPQADIEIEITATKVNDPATPMFCVARRQLLVDHANVDALVEADLEAVRPDLVDARLLLLARLTEEMIVEQMQMPRPWLAAPNLCNGVDRARLALFLQHYAEATFQILFERLRQAYELHHPSYIIVDLPPLAPVVDVRAMTAPR